MRQALTNRSSFPLHMLAVLAALIGAALIPGAAQAQCATPTEASALAQFRQGNSWTLLENGSTQITLRVSSTDVINGIPVFNLREDNPADGSAFYSDECSGIRFHRGVESDDELGDLTITMVPPIEFVNASPRQGDALTRDGTAVYETQSLGQLNGTYSSSTTVDGYENVTVPAGTFRALRVRWQLRLTLSVPTLGVNLDETDTSTLWLADGTGLVKTVDTSSTEPGVVETLELISANIVDRVPSPGATDVLKILPAVTLLLLDED